MTTTSPGQLIDGAGSLRPTAFAGDADIEELHAFFLPAHQYAGDTRWSFGTSLKSAYVNTFEFMNHAPVVQLWRDDHDELQAVSRLSLGTGQWFHQARPKHRTNDVTQMLIEHADAAFGLLTDRDSWQTVRYASHTDEIQLLERAGYTRGAAAEVYMTRPLEHPVEEQPLRPGVRIEILDASDAKMVHERAMAQIDAFSDAEPNGAERAWITRSLPHQMSFGRPDTPPSIVAVDASGTILAFADPFYDRENRIGEFEPVGTRTAAQRSGLAKAVMHRALNEMHREGMRQAIVRTEVDNLAAIAAYESVGFTIADLLTRLHKQRPQ